jgi:DNA-binding winged helix-turn-helix (wHTH) protein/tetratricopeptide (TPR) repeat protein
MVYKEAVSRSKVGELDKERVLRFGPYRLEDGVRLVPPTGSVVELRPKTAAVLDYLARHARRVIPREELLDAVWPNVHVTEESVTQCVAEIRRALGGDGASMLRTLPRRGYVLDAAEPAEPAGGPSQEEAAYLSPSGVPLLAMLPFEEVPTEPALRQTGDILLESIVGTLSVLREFAVVATNSTRHLRGSDRDILALARRLGADFVGTGTLRRLGERVRLNVEVAEARAGALVWGRTYDLTDAVAGDGLEDLAVAVAHALAPRIGEAELQKLRGGRDHDPGAYGLLLQARQVMLRMDPTTFAEARGLLRAAIVRDGGFAAPHATLGNWYSLLLGQRWSDDPAGDARALEETLRRALELDPDHGRALALLGHTYTIVHRRHTDAIDLLNEALARAPNDAETLIWTAPTLAYVGQAGEAVRRAERAIRLSPEDPLLFRYEHFLSIALYFAGDHERAASFGLRSTRRNPSYTSNLALTLAALVALGRFEEVAPLRDRLLSLLPDMRAGVMADRLPHVDPLVRRSYSERLAAAGVPR